MPVLTVNGEKKKVACGPCIRGHRSSKCVHKDRVLIEVRKPGRPLGVCPHPAGSCGCERVVINYVIPKATECPCPSDSKPIIPTSFSTPARVQKSKGRRSVSGLSQAGLQKAIDGDPSALGVMASHAMDATTNASSDTSSSKVASAASSSSSTPLVDAVDRNHEITLPFPGASGDDRFQGGIGADGWDSEWPEHYPRPNTSASQDTGASSLNLDSPGREVQTRSCCAPQPDSRQPIQQPRQSCCAPAPSETPLNIGIQPSPNMRNLDQAQRLHSFNQFSNDSANMTNGPLLYGPGMMLPFGMPEVPHNFLAYESSLGLYAQCAPSGPDSIQQRLSGIYNKRNCDCGDTCACFGCSTHPNNRTMTDYVRYHDELFMRAAQVPNTVPVQYGNMQNRPPQQYSPQYQYGNVAPRQPSPAAPAQFQQRMAQQPFSIQGFGIPQTDQMNWPATTASGMQLFHTPTVELEQFHLQNQQQHHIQTPQISHDGAAFANAGTFQGSPNQQFHSPEATPIQQATLRNPIAKANVESKSQIEKTLATFDPESPGDDDTASTLSPSSFLLQQYTLPGCDDVTGTCQCGDGCECTGCLTHSGHTRAESPSIAASASQHDVAPKQDDIQDHASHVDEFSLEQHLDRLFAQSG